MDFKAFTYGTVKGVNPLMVEVAGSTPAVHLKRMPNYSPAIGHHVLIAIVANGDRVVLGNPL